MDTLVLMRIIFLLVCIQLFCFWSGYSQQSGVEFQFQDQEKHDLVMRETESGSYEIVTKGKDPYLFTQPISSSLTPDQHILSFEYFSATGLDDVKLYFAPPVSESTTKEVGSLNASEGWTTFSIDLKDHLEEWGERGDYLRIDLGSTGDRTIQIREIKLRKPTERELEIAMRKEKRKEFESQLKNNLEAYLQKDFPDKINEVQVTPKEIIVSGNITSDSESLVLREVRLHEHVTELKKAKNSKTIEQQESFEIRLPRFIKEDERTYDRLLSKWVIAEQTASGFELCSHAHYPDNITPKWNLEEDKLRGRKGLGGFSATRDAPVSDLDSLGISSATVNIWVTNWMRSEPSKNTIPFTFNGKTYYVDREKVEDMDRTLRTASSRNIIVSAIILIGQAVDTPDKKIGEIFEHPDSDPAGIYSMANVTSPKGIEYYAAIMDFLAKRYNRPDKKFGRIHHWIVHNEVDAGWVWTNAGDKTPLVFMDLYYKSMRVIYNIARKYNPHSKVFISLTHSWTWAGTSNEKFYDSKNLLEILLDFSGAEGDFEWAIAYHPYPESLFEPKSWLDQKVDYTFDTPIITYKNIEVLDAWVKQPQTFYKGERRTVFLSEQGLNSPDYSKIHLKEQAAGMAYAWKKIKILDGIDAFQYHNWQDNRGEGGLRLGLRRFPDAKEEPGGKKPIWHVYKHLDTPQEDSATAFAKSMIGIDSWDQVRHQGSVGPDKEEGVYRDVKSDTWIATDALGRALPGYDAVGPVKEDRTVGIFYFLTHNNSGKKGPYNVTDILAEDPDNPEWGSGAHYWGEPETGYYLSTDVWMIRRHARMLSDAGVDVIIFDVTNNITFPNVYMKIAEVFQTMRAEGEKTPQFAFLASEASTLKLWDDLYSKGLYPDLWFRWKGKPLLMFGQWEKVGKMSDVTFPENMTDFFTIRESWAWTSLPWYDDGKKQWPWIDHFPQSVGWSDSTGHAEYVPVGVAQHPLSNIGRSYHNFHQPETNAYDLTPYTDQGLFFEEQWSRALEVEPEFVFITGWNEWSAGKQVMSQNIEESLLSWDFYPGAHLGKAGESLKPEDTYFIDQYNREYSRDIEPMRGGHKDNYYYQMMANIRRYKGARELEPAGPPQSIDLKSHFSQWNEIKPEFRDHQFDVSHRESPGNYQSGPYDNKTGRNDLMNMKVSRDEQYIYFYVSTQKPLTHHTDSNWMLLYIDADQNHDTGWEGYDYLVNDKVIDEHTTTIKKYKDQGWTDRKPISYRVEGNQLMLAIPRDYIGETEKVALDFHWADNIQETNEITEFFLNGDHSPERRANYRYKD
jgi:hypothetical protein